MLGVYLASAVLLVIAGAQKVLDPTPLVRALASTGLQVKAATVRAGAVLEVALGLVAATTTSRLVALGVAASYLAFTLVVTRALAHGGVLASCGCFGSRDVPPTRTHAVLTGAFALVALTVAGLGTAGGATTAPLLLAAAAVAGTAYAVLAVLPLVTAR